MAKPSKTKPINVATLIHDLQEMSPMAKVYIQVVHDLDCVVVRHGPVYGARKGGPASVLIEAADDVS